MRKPTSDRPVNAMRYFDPTEELRKDWRDGIHDDATDGTSERILSGLTRGQPHQPDPTQPVLDLPSARPLPSSVRGTDSRGFQQTRTYLVKIHEYQAKTILARYGVPIPKGEVAFT